MTFSYNETLLTTDLNKVRRLIGDVSSTAAEFSDEEIDFFNDQEANIYGASSLAASALALKYAGQVNKTVGKLKIELSKKSENYQKMSDSFRLQASSKGSPGIFAGGLSKSGKRVQEADTDRVEPDFKRGLDDFPGTNFNDNSRVDDD